MDVIRERTAGLGADVVIVATPSGSAQSQAIDLVRRGGQVVFFGGLPKERSMTALDGNKIHYGEITVRGAFGYPKRQHAQALDLIERGKISASRFITHHMPLQGVNEGMGLLQAGEALKIVLEP
jgi:L-iditol 2-dehydrogenase